MENDRRKKLKQYIKEGRPEKFKSYCRKHHLDVKKMRFCNGKTLLHYCCKYQNSVCFRYIMEKKINTNRQDHHGNTALHVALIKALQCTLTSDITDIYSLMIFPLMEVNPKLLDVRNDDGTSCRELLDLLQMQQQRTTTTESTDSWEDKLADELQHEYSEEWGRFSHCSSHEDEQQETYTEWSDRIRQEYHRKRKQQTQPSAIPSSSKKPKENHHNEDLEKEREKMRHKYEINQRKAQEDYKKHKKLIYEKRWVTLAEKCAVTSVKYSDIPWPFRTKINEIEDFLLHDISEKDNCIKYIRDQIKKWHPDKFLQKVGKHIEDCDRDRVIDMVKQVSQELNQISDRLKES